MKNILVLIAIFTSAITAQDYISKKPENDYRGQVWIENRMKSNEPSSFKNNIITDNKKKKNTGLAVIYSLLLPGMGELYAESYSSGKYFTIAEGALWGVYIGMNTYGNWQKDRYKSFAASNAGITTQGKNDDYFSNISIYENIDAYNNAKALEGNFGAMYDERQYYWSWSENDRRRYRSLWVSSEQAFNNLRFVVGALILNRVASAINAVRLVSAFNKKQESELSWNLSAGVMEQQYLPAGVCFNFQTNF